MAKPLTPERIADIAAKVEHAHTEICEVASEGARNRFRMSIPANPNRDTDLIISDALKGTQDLLAEVERLKTENAHLDREWQSRGAKVIRLDEELREAQDKLWAVAKVRVWKNEDRRAFVFVEDLCTALGVPVAEAVSG